MKYPLLEEIGGHFMTEAVKLVKSGRKFVFVLDNIDWMVKAHDMRIDEQNRMVHAVATSLVFDRVPQHPSPLSGAQQTLATVNMKVLVELTENERVRTKERYKIILGRILCEFFTAFQRYHDLVPKHTLCPYSKEMSSPSVVVPFPVMMKDEKTYSELVDVLDAMEVWVHDIYSRAGVLPDDANLIHPGPPVQAPARAGQPAAHTPSVENSDSIPQVPCYGDQLTRVRMAGAKDLRAGTHTPKDRLEHLYPFRIVDWHTKRSFLKVG